MSKAGIPDNSDSLKKCTKVTDDTVFRGANKDHGAVAELIQGREEQA